MRTALMLAAERGDLDMVNMLLEAGASVEQQNEVCIKIDFCRHIQI